MIHFIALAASSLALRFTRVILLTLCIASVLFGAAGNTAAIAAKRSSSYNEARDIVDAAVAPVMRKDAIPGMAVSVMVHGTVSEFYYGVASVSPRRPVSDETLFEIGSISKTLTATLASYAEVLGRLSLSDPTSKYVPLLRGTKFGDVALVGLGTHTAGGFPLQFPDGVTNDEQALRYFAQCKPTYPPGTYRTYANPSIAMLGFIAAKSMGQPFEVLMQHRLLPGLGMQRSFITVPDSEMPNYAEGYTHSGRPIRMAPGAMAAEAYGIRTTAGDLMRFLQENMAMIDIDPGLQKAIMRTHIGYFKDGPFTQDLIWEQYGYPVSLRAVLRGNSPKMIFSATRVTPIAPPKPAMADVWLNKTGSTNGFGAYVAFVPKEHMAVVILANSNFPIAHRVTIAYRILTALSRTQNSARH